MTDAEFLAELQSLSSQHPIVFLTFGQLEKLRDLAQRLPLVTPANHDRWAIQSTTLHSLILSAQAALAARVKQQLLK